MHLLDAAMLDSRERS